MTTIEFKSQLKKFPESAWFLGKLNDLFLSGRYTELIDFLSNKTNIENATIEELYIKQGLILRLKLDCQNVLELIDKLGIDLLNQFEDKEMSITDIGIKTYDKFECIQDFNHWDTLLIQKHSIISIVDFKYAGKDSLIVAKIEKFVTTELYHTHFPTPSEIPIALTFNELKTYFNRID